MNDLPSIWDYVTLKTLILQFITRKHEELARSKLTYANEVRKSCDYKKYPLITEEKGVSSITFKSRSTQSVLFRFPWPTQNHGN